MRYWISLCSAVTAAGEDYGTIAAITHPGRHDVYEVARPDGTTSLFPAAPPFMAGTDVEAGIVRVKPIPGMFSAAESGDAP